MNGTILNMKLKDFRF